MISLYLRHSEAWSWPVETFTYCWVIVEPPPTPPVSLVPQRAADAGQVEAGVGVERAVLGRQHGLPDVLGHLVERDDRAVDVVRPDRGQRGSPSANLNVATWVTAVWSAEGTLNITQPTRNATTGTRTARPSRHERAHEQRRARSTGCARRDARTAGACGGRAGRGERAPAATDRRGAVRRAAAARTGVRGRGTPGGRRSRRV